MTFLSACMKFFGKDRGEVIQTMKEFKDETAALTHKDKCDIRDGLVAAGWDVDPVVAPGFIR